MKFKKKAEKIVVLVSGGFDSVILANFVRESFPESEITGLFFGYGQQAYTAEKRCSQRACKKLGFIFKEIDLPKFEWTKSEFYKEGFISNDKQCLESRNIVFLSYALSYCQSIGATSIYAAILKSLGYFDTSDTFLDKFGEICLDSGVNLYTPFSNYDKKDLSGYVFKYNIQKEDFNSCDTPDSNGRSCGKCPDCLITRELLEENEIKTPFDAFCRNKGEFDGEFEKQVRNFKIEEVRLLINNDCQLNCKHCFYGFKKMKSRELTFEEYCGAIKQAVDLGIKEFHFSGKEPLFDEKIFRYAEYIRSLDKGCNYHVVTNGINVPKYAKKLKELNFAKVFLSVDDVLVASDYRTTHSVYKEALKALNDYDIPVQVFIDLGKHNYNKVQLIVEYLANNFGVKEFYVRTVMPVGNAEDLKALTLEELSIAIEQLQECSKKHNDLFFTLHVGNQFVYDVLNSKFENGVQELKKMFNWLLDFGSSSYSDNFEVLLECFCCRYTHQITLTPDGYVLGCAFEVASEEYDKVAVGNILNEKMAVLISNGKDLNILGNEKQHKLYARKGKVVCPCHIS